MKAGLHGHCRPNCFREIRDFSTDDMVNLLEVRTLFHLINFHLIFNTSHFSEQ